MRNRILAATSTLFVAYSASTTWAASPDLDEYAIRSRWARIRAIANWEQSIVTGNESLKKARRGKVDRSATQSASTGQGMVYHTPDAKKADIAKYSQQIETAKTKLAFITPTDSLFFAGMPSRKPKAGDIISLTDKKVKLFQGLKDDAALVELPYWTTAHDQEGRG